ncbi:iron-sulfur cluster repair di-iron protein [Pararhodobacter sp.]|uniref:iron-sulfur cluster repair di-iron protein n=1 Tax=Pararhodobacter sp. TaxID=2127056 RepID=UPI002AFEF620|nr:iron-sulfur cluster repair di-iron protein [Pararhodobacter sp.]
MTPLSHDMTVGTIAAELPGAAELFRAKGISFCCGGTVALSEAALNAGLLPDRLLTDLQALSDAAGREAPESTADLIAYILSRYHETHRTELDFLIPLSQKVERVHGAKENAPLGLAEALIALKDELDDHMAKEEAVLFPLMLRGGHPMIVHPITQMRHEHDEATELLVKIEHVTNGLTLPAGACGSWTALYTGVRKFADDLVAHIHLENTVLFPRFEHAAA